MYNRPVNLVFEGGGVLGIAYLGVLQYLYQNGLIQKVERTAGTSAGAITACLTSFQLPFEELKAIADTLDYKKVPGKEIHPDLSIIAGPILNEIETIVDDFSCVYRLLNNYGWFSSEYFYSWMQKQIASQFNPMKKRPPYTFADFKNPYLHQNERPFLDLYVVGTDLSYHTSKIFSYETTPNMEVAQAVRISMSIPLFFEAVQLSGPSMSNADSTNVLCDGGVMWNYPINMFDSFLFKQDQTPGVNSQTLGARFLNKREYHEINTLLGFVKNIYLSQLSIQQDMFHHSPQDIARSIQIDPGTVSALNFDISPGDDTYDFLYYQGYIAAQNYFRQQ